MRSYRTARGRCNRLSAIDRDTTELRSRNLRRFARNKPCFPALPSGAQHERDPRQDGFDSKRRKEMNGRTFAALILGAASLIAASNANAQQPNQLDQCRDEAIRRQISGDRLSGFLTQCMQEKAAGGTSGTMDRRASYERCRSEAAGRGFSGDMLYSAVGDCLQRSGSSDANAMSGSYQQCRSNAVARGFSGTQLDQYLRECTTH
jgi:hypothetical protein